MGQQLTLLCLSHLNWDHVWQRPQQLMTRFTSHCSVIYIDPPQIDAGTEKPHLRERPGDQGVQVFRPFFPQHLIDSSEEGFWASYWPLWFQLLPEVLEMAGPNMLLWVFSPLADELVARAKPQAKITIYDCMDDLASFRDGGELHRRHEANLLELVDLVFTGGNSMYQARKDRHPRVHCFPSGVDVDHYRTVLDPATPIAPALAEIPHPQLGYFGVLDERIDWPLIAEVAARRPAWHWTMVGPTAKVSPEELPAAPNVHYLGQQQYRDLPSFLKSFDIATMPFALNEATRFISPTKTLEYLAGGKLVLSSSVPDVVASYSSIVTIADGADAWIAAAEQLLGATAAELEAKRALAEPILAQSTWDSIAGRMWALMEERLVAKAT